MSAPPSWDDVISAIEGAITSVLKGVADAIRDHASTLAKAFVVAGLIGAFGLSLTRVPFVNRLLRMF